MRRKHFVLVASAFVLLSAALLPACDDGIPSTPSPALSPTGPSAPAPVDVSRLLGVWDVTVRLTDVNGRGCVAETMRSQMGEPSRYSLSLTQKGPNNVDATLTSASSNYACTFGSVLVDSGGFTTYNQGGYFRCVDDFLIFSCADGTVHSLFSWGQDIAGRISASEMSGSWDAAWDDMSGAFGVEAKAQFTGRRR